MLHRAILRSICFCVHPYSTYVYGIHLNDLVPFWNCTQMAHDMKYIINKSNFQDFHNLQNYINLFTVWCKLNVTRVHL